MPDAGEDNTLRESRAPPRALLDGKYRVVRQIGEGGMGTVHEAVHTLIDRRCAVKFLHPEIARDEQMVKRFLREAKAAAAIGHAGIVHVYDIGTTPHGMPFLVMEYLDGTNLAEYLRGGRKLPVEEAAEIAVQSLSALALAHRKGIVHRDLKPANLFLTRPAGGPRTVKILDFGISKMTLGAGTDKSMTNTGAVLGTPQYMSPEQAEGRRNIDHRTDLYAIGVILYECVVGRVPHEGENYNQLLARILTETILTPRELDPAIAEPFEAIILKALENEPEERFATAEEMIQDLLPFLTPEVRGRLTLPEGMSATEGAGIRHGDGGGPRGRSTPSPRRDAFPNRWRTRRRGGTWIAVALLAATLVAVVSIAFLRSGAESSAPASPGGAEVSMPTVAAGGFLHTECESGNNPGACVTLGAEAARHHRTEEAKQFYLRGCDGGAVGGCTLAGKLLLKEGFKGDGAALIMGEQYLLVACRKGYRPACDEQEKLAFVFTDSMAESTSADAVGGGGTGA
ncbi:MAG: serine/threonine-protein kinase, partial [Myxococcota bacterium]|nr:serine/threonine-protein kinase [Myxococcota bacterium]